MGSTFKLYSKLDKRQKIKLYKLNNYFYDKFLKKAYKTFEDKTEIEFWPGNIPVDSLVYIVLSNKKRKNNNNYMVKFFTTNMEAQNFFTFTFDYNYFYKFTLLLKLKYNDVYFPVDMCFYKNLENRNIITGFSSYFTNNYYRLIFSFDKNYDTINFLSISTIYPSFTWVERELSELNEINFLNLKDGRRLLTDYTTLSIDNDDYKTTSYSLAVENLYNNKMLHWMYIFSFFLSCSLLSFIFYNKNLISLLLISEIVILIVFFLTIIIASFYNISFLLSFSFFLLIFGGLELALNLLLLML